MSVTAKKWVRKHSPARGSRRTVLIELAWDADEAGQGARLSTLQLANATGLSASTVKRALRELEREQLIVRHRGDRSHCESCAAARHGAHVFDVVIQQDATEPVDPNQMTLLQGATVTQGQNVTLGQDDPGSWVMVTQQEEVEDCSLSLDHVREDERQDPGSLSEAELEPVARPAARGAAVKPVSYRGRTVPRATVLIAERLLGAFNDATGGQLAARGREGQATAALKQIAGALLERPDEPAELWERGVRAMCADPPQWVDGRLMIGHVFGSRAAEHTLARGRGETGTSRNGRRGLSASDWGAIAENLEQRERVAA